MKRIVYLFLMLALGLSFNSCETDFDVTAEWKDIAVVYGLLNPEDSFTYIKVNKVFLGEGNALVMASNPDSSYYAFDEIEVTMEEYLNGNFTGKTFTFDTLTVHNKDLGTFYAPDQVLYVSNTYKKLNPGRTYRLLVRNTRTGKEVSAETPLVSSFSIEKPLYNPNNPVTGFNGTVPYTAEWYSTPHGKRYELVVRFNYYETVPGSGDTTHKTIDWVFAPKKSMGLNGGEKMELKYEGAGFLSYIESNIPVNPDVKRSIGMVDFIFSVGADELNTYIE
ncbi:MAG: DUF4249 family protein, partial [Bacteroidales bacterium]|nr:DUF4249 family protein [Bacteroidales bacterium]